MSKSSIQNTITQRSTGKVYLISAGPGDPELITIKAAKAIAECDVLLVDRLVSPDIIKNYARPDAIIIEVGKQCKTSHTTPQAVINELIVEYALKGHHVARLKGGDVTIFSNVLDELYSCKNNGIEYVIIPGVTSAIGAAAYAGFPLTARGYSVGVRLLTFYKNDIIPENYWKELASSKDTLVFYMSSGVLPLVIENLVSNGVDSEISVAVIEQATTPLQRIHTFNIYDFDNYKDHAWASPTIIIIGKVVNLHHEFNWMFNESNEVSSNAKFEFFKQVENEFIQKNLV
jgi:uroporphyrin-III C-methyltransferase / precorrin-2 dehydrogenase / sirohydrochlorin ferrochelatase